MLLVVNSADSGSQTIANHYLQLRSIPPSNVFYLDWRGSDAQIDVNTFREKFLRPIAEEIVARNLSAQIDYVVYSSQFPYAVDFRSDVPEELRNGQSFQFPVGSLSGLTFLMRQVISKDFAAYAGMNSNHYMRLRDSLDGKPFEVPMVSLGNTPESVLIPAKPPQLMQHPPNGNFSVGSHGFRNWYGWGPDGDLMEAGGTRYMLSAMLGVTYGRGNSAKEILNYLEQSASADGTHPKGTIYYMDTGDPHRSGPRRPAFDFAVALLKELGVNAVIEHGDVPKHRADVQGLMTGIAEFNWGASGSLIRPGAFCEDLTSFGGDFDPKQGQTPMSDFLRFGAAGASGAVAEPFSIQNKFPYALVQVHYARGCSMAEAFYQSVFAPYQLLLAGDPLCRPWANIPRITVEGVQANDILKGKVTLRPFGTIATTGKVDQFQLFVDGLLVAVCAAGESLEFESAQYFDGFHELRIVGIENSAVESQGRLIVGVHFNNYDKKIRFEASPRSVHAGLPIKLSAAAADVVGVAFYHNKDHLIAKFNGASGEAIINSAALGEGPVTLQAVGWGRGGQTNTVIADPIQLTIESAGSAR